MKLARIPWVIALFALGTCLPFPSSLAAVDLTGDQVRYKVRKLINSNTLVHIQGIRVEKASQGGFNLEINADLGTCWGKKAWAKGFARDTLKTLYDSDLPISHVIVNVYEGRQALLSVGLGRNQAQRMDWDAQGSLHAFYERLKSRTNYQGDPADYCWLIEKGLGPKP